MGMFDPDDEDYSYPVNKKLETKHVEALAAVLCADDFGRQRNGELTRVVEEKRYTLEELMRIIRLAPSVLRR